MKFTTTSDRIFVALDVPDAASAKAIVERLGDYGTSYKIGLQLFCSAGPGIVSEIAGMGKNVFLDLKFHDIPNTVAGAVKSVAGLGASIINLHCHGGSSMMEAAAEAIEGDGAPAIIGVTVLTSLADNDLSSMAISNSAADQVLLMAQNAKAAGLQGVVCSPKEITVLRKKLGQDFMLITPGIRPQWAAKGDQKRVKTPAEAIREGATALVIGRPITGAENPAVAMARIIEEIEEG